jgi:hypothetical protein
VVFEKHAASLEFELRYHPTNKKKIKKEQYHLIAKKKQNMSLFIFILVFFSREDKCQNTRIRESIRFLSLSPPPSLYIKKGITTLANL